MTTPRLSALHVYPIKSVRGLAPGEAAVEPWGLAGDRRWMLTDTAGRFLTQRQWPRLALACTEPLGDGGVRIDAPGMAPLVVAATAPGGTRQAKIWRDTVEVALAERAAGEWFSAFLGTTVELVQLPEGARRRPLDPRYSRPGETVGLADGFPLLLTTTASLNALNALISAGDHPGEAPLPMNRFRPNLVVDGTEAWAEDDWHRVRIGEVVFRVAKPCGRCVVTTTDQQSARRGKEPLHSLGLYRRFSNKLLFGQNLVPEHRGTVRLGDPFSVLE